MDQQVNKQLNIAMIFDDLMIGGWTTMASAIPGFDRNRINPVIICLFGKGYYADVLEKRGFKIHFLGINKLNAVFKIAYLAWLLRKNKVSIVHTHLLLSHMVGQTAAVIAGIRGRIMHVHAVEKDPGGIYSLWMKWISRNASMIIPVSCAVEKTFLETYPSFKGKSKVIYNGIDVCEFRRRFSRSWFKRADFKIGPDDFCVVTVANFKSEKGHRYLIEAATLLKDDGIRFLLVGDGSEKEGIMDEVTRCGLDKQFVFLGTREDVPELLSLADIMVLPSIEEGFGICLLEAFAAGIPVLATDVCGISEIAENGKDAILISASNPQEIAEGIRKFKEDTGLRGSLSENAKTKILDFDIGKVIQSYTDAYCQMTGNRKEAHH
ncbi:MAG TPA: hypothetical protein DCZ94_07590 [Lentisphaeria bacterium]|nr:MAG: hypothetical protein A2X48_14265 [Lentisphaerae bacterium GWF2_49_21]HBC86799.1 hypothetical protein [Lentisphaeria bacterium]